MLCLQGEILLAERAGFFAHQAFVLPDRVVGRARRPSLPPGVGKPLSKSGHRTRLIQNFEIVVAGGVVLDRRGGMSVTERRRQPPATNVELREPWDGFGRARPGSWSRV